MPPLPMSLGWSSNCGFTRSNSSPAASGTSAGTTSASEMNERSATIKSKRPTGRSRASRWRALTPSRAATRESAARRRSSWPWPTSTPTTRAAPRWSRTSVKPPVPWPTSRQTKPRTSIAQRASAASSLRPPRETKRSSASSTTSISAASGTSSPAFLGTAQPEAARQRTPPRSIRRCAAERLGATPRCTNSWSARIALLRSIAVGVGLVRPFLGDADVRRLLVGQLGEHRADLLQVQPRDLLVEVLRQHVDLADLVLRALREELDLRDRLVGEARRHHEARMPRAAAEVHEPALGEQDDPLAIGEDHVVDLRLDLLPLVLLDRRDVDLVVEVADVADDRLVLHRAHVLVADDALV